MAAQDEDAGPKGKEASEEKGRDLGIPPLPLLDWSDGRCRLSVEALFGYVDDAARAAIGWYWKRARWKRQSGSALRLFSILFFSLGALVPLLLAAGIDISSIYGWFGARAGSPAQAGQLGYVAISLGGVSLAVDHFFGQSSSWIRFVTTATELQTALQRFYLDWAQLTAAAGRDLTPEKCAPLLERLQTFVALVRDRVEKETRQWASEYQGRLAEMERQWREGVKAEAPRGAASKPGEP